MPRAFSHQALMKKHIDRAKTELGKGGLGPNPGFRVYRQGTWQQDAFGNYSEVEKCESVSDEGPDLC